ncbi:MAG: HYR domain-containing protein, partial [Crocinitomicaceae bacterium]|nr:HYR domain-containing protein [Crocinitomicaceae bacterium]
AGNSATCNFTVTVTDNENPTITCPGNASQTADAGNCSAVVNALAPTTADNCGVTLQTWALTGATTANSAGTGINDASGQTFNVGVTTVTYYIEDAAGNSATCNFTVTVTDNEAPTVNTCPANVIVNADPGLCTASLDPADPIITDNCSISSITWAITGASTGNSPGTGINYVGSTVYNVGVSTISYTAVDAAGNADNSCSFTITVNDNISPTITCPFNVGQGTDPGVCTAVVNGLAPITNDNCGVTLQTWSLTGATTANSAASGINDASGQTFNIGTTTVTYYIEDAVGNSATCSFDVLIQDLEIPTITCPANVAQNNDAGLCSAVINAIGPISNDNCGVVLQTWSLTGVTNANSSATGINDASGEVFNVGATAVTYYIEDAAGNSATCNFTVTVLDNENPTISCPANVIANVDPGNCTAVVNGIAPTTNDNCGVALQTWSLTGATTASSPALGINDASGQVFNVGLTTVTYYIEDAAGNSATCNFTVTISDNENPTITCPSNVTQGIDPGNCTAVVNAISPTTSDNCGVTLQTWTLTGATTANSAATGINDASGQTFNVGVTTVTYYIEDAAGNSATCNFTVTISDNENPTITCPANVAQNNDIGSCSAVVSGIAPITTGDNCGITIQIWALTGATTANSAGTGINDASGQTFNIGTTTVTYTVTDAAGNSTNCAFDVVITDAENPTITCPANINANNDPGVCGKTITYATPIGTDNCPGSLTMLTAGFSSGSVFPVGTTTVTYLVADASANTASCSFDVTVNDVQLPTISCPSNISQNNDAGICGAVVTYTAPVGADNCPGSVTSLIAGFASGANFPVGVTTVTYEVVDASSNAAQCSFNVTVNDTELPTISCPADITVNNDAGVCGAAVAYATPVGADNCPASVTSLTAGLSSGSTFNVGTTVVTYQVVDASSNSASCSFNVIVNDIENPTIVCPADITQSNDAALCGASVTYVAPVGIDNCAGSVTSMTAGQISGTVFPIGTTIVTYQVVDASSNTASCSFNVTVNDTEFPTITCPANITTTNNIGVCGRTVSYGTPLGTDNCPGSVTTLTAGLASGSLFPIGTTVVTYQVVDATGNTSSCSFNVTVNDTQLPTIACPSNISQSNDAGVCGANVTYAAPVGVDNCPGSVTTLTAGQASGTVFPTGTTVVTYQVVDASSNTASCSFNVTINDTELPTILCPADITVTNDLGVCGATINYVAPVGADNCPGSVTTLTAGQASGTVFPVGTTVVTYQVVDASSNVASCSFNVVVNDTELPTISCPANIIQSNDPALCGAVVTYAAPVGVDNCPGSITSMTTGQVSGTVFPIGTTVVTYQVVDPSSNTASCSFNVTVNDTEFPTITCPANITTTNNINVCGKTVTYGTPVGADNCPGSVTTLTAGQASGTIFPIGTTTVTYQVVDASGNTTSCSFNVTVNDVQIPTIACPSNITQSNDAGVCGATVTYATPVGVDNCPGSVTTLIAGQASGTVFPIGTTLVTYQVVDPSSNTASCSFNVTVNDTQLPTISCPADITVSNDLAVCGATVNYVTPVGADNCPGSITTLTAGLASGSIFPIGTTVVTYQVVDASSNSASCSFNVIVNDTELPTISCPANITQSNDPALCGAVISYVAPVGVDNCPGSISSMTTGQVSGTVFPIGTTTLTFQVVDASSNSATCSFDITVNDTELPTISCPANITTNNDPGVCGKTVTYGTPVGTDNCPGSVTSLTAGQASGTIFPIGTTTVTYQVVDASSNSASCSFTVTVNDNENPVIVCPSNITQSNDAGLCGAIVTYAAPVGTDNCPGSITSMTTGQASGTVFPIGTTVVTYQVVDASTNTTSCSFNVTVNDTQLPTISCPADINVSNDIGICGATVNYATPVGLDNCPGSITSMTAGQASGTIFPIGTTVVSYQVVDASSNSAACSFLITVDDTENPTITCPANITVGNNPGLCGATVTYVAPVGNDNCPGSVTSLTAGQVSGTVFALGTTTVTYQVVDASSNTASCSFNVTVNDTENPTINCPANITVSNDPGVCGATVTYTAPTGNDNCPGATTVMTAGQASGTLFPIGTTTVTYLVTDGSGNTASCSFTVTVNDTEAPTITCPADITTNNIFNVCGATVAFVAPVGADNCPGSVTSMTAGLPSGALFPVGTTVQTFQVLDASGNSTTCSFNIIVNDNQNPAITCPANITQSNDPGICGGTVTYTAPTGTDNCPGSTTTLIAGLPSGSLFPIGTTTVTYQVTDPSGNTNQCSFDVTINDTESPTIVCPVDITVSNDPGVCGAVVTYVAPVGADNCPGSVTGMIAGLASGSLFPIGTTVVTYEVIDASGNNAQCSFNVTVNDNENPTLTCPSNIVISNDAGICGATVNYITPVGLDNCPGSTTTLIAGQASGTIFPVGLTTVTYQVVDASGNSVQCSFDVTVLDTELPTIACPGNITVSNDAGVCGAIVNYSVPVGLDNCPAPVTNMILGQASGTFFSIGTTTQTYQVIDASGNSAQCSFNVTVNDTENPIISCPANITVSNDPGVCGATINYVTPVGADNCPGSVTNLTAGMPSGSLFPIGTTVVTYQVIDASTNSTSCSFNITINDTEAPSAICPPDQIEYFDASCQHILQNYTGLVVTGDNCAVASIVQSPAPGTVLFTDQLITMTVNDIYGNSTNCTFNVLISDTTSPVINCPATQNVFFDASCQYSLLDYTVMATTSDNCGIVTVTQFPAVGTLISGTTTVTLTADDGNGNTSVCSFDVIPTDNIPPSIACPLNQNVAFNANCEYVLLNYTGMAVTLDNCGPLTVTQSPAAGTIITGTTTVTLTVTDGAGLSTSCSFNVIPTDQTIPTIACPPDQNVFFDTNCQYTLLDYTTLPAVADNCGPLTVTQSPVAGTVISLTTLVTLTVADGAGNLNTCSFNVIPADTIKPTISCPGNQTVSLNANCEYVMTNFKPLTVSSDNCGVTSVVQSIPIGTIITSTQTLFVTAFDATGNSKTCSFDVIPVDNTPPVINCPANQNVSFNVNCQYILIDYTIMALNSDNCGPITITQIPAPGTAIAATTAVTLTATDGAGNSTSCSFNVIPSDNTPPVITSCPPDQNEYVGVNCKYTLPDYTGSLVATDNCSPFTVTQLPSAGTDIGVNTPITLYAEDASGNVSSCTFNVLLSDTISPTISCPPQPLTVYFDVNCEYIIEDYSLLVSANDNCGTTVISQIPAIGTPVIANQQMTMIVTDASGNTGQCLFMVIPIDTIAPVIGCPGDQVQYLNDTCHSVLLDYTAMANTTANCEAVIVTQQPLPGTVFNSTQTVLLFGQDASGNVSFCSFNVTLTDTTKPQITCPPDIHTCDNDVTFVIPFATDNCGPVTVTRINGLPSGSTFPDGITNQVYVATDAYGNTDTCSFVIEVFEKPIGDPVATNISCIGEVDGTIDLTVTAGNPPFTYQWSNSSTSEDLAGLAEGTYQCVITDAEGCVDTVTAEIIEPDSLHIDESITQISCWGEIDGKVVVFVTGGTFPYSYTWTPMGAGNTAKNLPEGTYTITIVDARGCTISESYSIIEPDSMTIDGDVSQYSNGWQISHENGSDGWIDLMVTGGNAPYNYMWDNGETTDFISDLVAGTYTVIVTDDNGCEQQNSFILDQPLAPVLYTGFSPNGDGHNETFQIKNIHRYPDNTLTVMNRWGDVVYQMHGYDNSWDGTPNKGIVLYGDKVPEGSYFYIFDLGDGSGEKITGYIVIKR